MKLLPDQHENASFGLARDDLAGLEDFIAPWATVEYTNLEFGHVLVQELETPEFSIYLWKVDAKAEGVLHPSSDRPTIAIQLTLGQDIPCELYGFGKKILEKGRAELFYVAPSVNKAFFQPGISESLHIELGPGLLKDIGLSNLHAPGLLESHQDAAPAGIPYAAVDIDFRFMAVIDTMRHCSCRGARLLLEMKIFVLQLLSLYIDCLEKVIPDEALPYIPNRELYFKIYQHILEEPHIHNHSMTNLSRRFGISPSPMTRNFRVLFGKTPAQFVRFHALEKAKLLLQTTMRSVEDIAGEIGYGEANNFYPAFRQQYDRSPGDLRKGPKH
jgi:AraC-like DNA-binding protein